MDKLNKTIDSETCASDSSKNTDTAEECAEQGEQGTILIMAGGTGGHIFPGIAVAQALQQQGWQIHWLGTEDRMEAQLVPQHGFAISFVNIVGVRNKGVLAWLKLPFILLQSLWQSLQIIRSVAPDVVLGMGGYASAPGGLAAWLMRKPLILHEQNAMAGLSNRCLARIATQVLSAFPGAFQPSVKAQVVGNPLRSSIMGRSEVSGRQSEKNTEQLPKADSERRNLLVVGGSLGAQILNEVVPKAIASMTSFKVNVWHQTGADKKQKVLAAYQQLGQVDQQVKVTTFIDDMAMAYRWADLVICRAGALTVSELAMAGKPAIFVPLPHAVDDHQTKNALYLVKSDAAKLLPQNQFNPTSLVQLLNSLLLSKRTLESMAKAARSAAHGDATLQVSAICQAQLKCSIDDDKHA